MLYPNLCKAVNWVHSFCSPFSFVSISTIGKKTEEKRMGYIFVSSLATIFLTLVQLGGTIMEALQLLLLFWMKRKRRTPKRYWTHIIFFTKRWFWRISSSSGWSFKRWRKMCFLYSDAPWNFSNPSWSHWTSYWEKNNEFSKTFVFKRKTCDNSTVSGTLKMTNDKNIIQGR